MGLTTARTAEKKLAQSEVPRGILDWRACTQALENNTHDTGNETNKPQGTGHRQKDL